MVNYIAFVFFLFFEVIGYSQTTKIASYTVGPEVCKTQQYKINAFTVFLFCEDALGAYLGIVYSDRIGQAGDKGWEIEKRFWQDKTWSSDVTSFLLDPEFGRIFIATSSIYGTGDIYEINLYQKKAKKIEILERSKVNGNLISSKIVNYDPVMKTLNVEVKTERGLTKSSIQIKN